MSATAIQEILSLLDSNEFDAGQVTPTQKRLLDEVRAKLENVAESASLPSPTADMIDDARLRMGGIIEGYMIAYRDVEEHKSVPLSLRAAARSLEYLLDAGFLVNPRNGIIQRLFEAESELARLKANWDVPETDCTDVAHPAWWRGEQAGVQGVVRIISEILDGKPHTGAFADPSLNALANRLSALVRSSDSFRSSMEAILDEVGNAYPNVAVISRISRRFILSSP